MSGVVWSSVWSRGLCFSRHELDDRACPLLSVCNRWIKVSLSCLVLVSSCLVWSGLTGLVWSGLACSGLGWSGLGFSGLVWSGLACLVSFCLVVSCVVLCCVVLCCVVLCCVVLCCVVLCRLVLPCLVLADTKTSHALGRGRGLGLVSGLG